MTLQANNRNGTRMMLKSDRSMPAWVGEQSGRIGPKPPTPPATPENGHAPPAQPQLPPKAKSQPEPDYEVIEFSNQQYSNAPARPSSSLSGSKTPDSKLKCTLCGSNVPWVTCEECAQQIFCASCDDMYHKHPKRNNHQRKTLEQNTPPLPPKILPGQPGPAAPVAPPRRKPRGMMTPLLQRKDQVNNHISGSFVVPPSPSPSVRNASWHDGGDTLKRGVSMFNRPLPETPKTPTTPSESSRCGTPKSLFDTIQKPPSVVLEKIKNKANATLDRMQLLQQRYRQQKEQMERDRSGSALDQNIRSFDQWSSISPSPSHFRSGSMSSGINSSHLDLTDDSSFNLFHQRQLARQHHQMAAQRANQLGQRGMSSSVFNLNQVHRKPPIATNGWANSSMQQAQSVAHLNCVNCSHPPQWGGQHVHMHQQDPWSNRLNSQQHLNHSNLSLNIGPGYMMQPPHNGMYPPPVFMNQHHAMGHMYPQAYMGGMPVMNPGLAGVPPSVSRTASRPGSRMASPAMSRKSVTLRRKQRTSYRDDEATDDEDSDEDDRRSTVSNRSGVSRTRQRRLSSNSQMQVEEDLDAAAAKLRSRVRSQRRDSVAKSVHNDWAPGRKNSGNNNRSVDSGFNSPLKPSRIYSDLDSEGSGTRALVQAKIEQKLKEETLKQEKQTKTKRRSESPIKQKHSAAVQTTGVEQKKGKEKDTNKDEKQTAANESEEDYEVEEENATDDGSEEEEEDREEDSDAHKESKSELTNGPTPSELTAPAAEEDAVSLGPPPSTPDQEWECEFCTFVNEANIKICTICCKTPSKPPKLVSKSSSPPKQATPSSTCKEKTGTLNEITTPINDTNAITDPPQSFLASLTLKDNEPITTDVITDTNAVTQTTSSSIQARPIQTAIKKETVDDIWATLDEDIQATAHEVTRKAESAKTPTKVSTGCGTSSKPASVERPDAELRKSQAREIGTSPPPQTIATQTYDTITLKRPETGNEPTQTQCMRPPQSIANDAIQQSNFTKIRDLKSFENEVLNNIHNISHVPSQYQHNHPQQPPYYPSHERNQRYRSINDLRMDDSMSVDFDSFNGMGRRHPSIGELLLLQRTSSQMHSPLTVSNLDLSYRHNGMDNHKEADLYKYTTEELNAALKYSGPDMHPLVWLRDNWPKLIQTVQSLATKYGQERAENTIGTISQMEAREALRQHNGNIWQAVSECIEQRQRKYREISNKGNFSREDVVTALTTHQGNVELALMDLGRNQLKPFLMRIWGSPGGVENESGAMVIPPSPQSSLTTPYTMDKDIHNFLSANASDCMQVPNATSAFTPTTQMPSPFDLPASLVNPYDTNNTMPDNTSCYSADSKDYATSPFPVDEAILNNKSMLKDLESLIGTMEQNQQKQNEQVLRSIQDMITNMKQDKPENEYDPETMRILTKSPITSPKLKTPSNDKNLQNEADVKSFVWQHIQEIVPNLVQQVEMELREDQTDDASTSPKAVQHQSNLEPETPKDLPPPPPPIDQDEFLMEEVIKPNLRNASIREELPPQYVYASEIATFQMAFDKGLARQHETEFEFDCLEEASKRVFKMYKVPDVSEVTASAIGENTAPAALEHIPVTVTAITLPTSEPPKQSSSPMIPLTIDDVVCRAPPEIPPFEDIIMDSTVALNGNTVIEDFPLLTASVNAATTESSSEVPQEEAIASITTSHLDNPDAKAITKTSIQVELEIPTRVSESEMTTLNESTRTKEDAYLDTSKEEMHLDASESLSANRIVDQSVNAASNNLTPILSISQAEENNTTVKYTESLGLQTSDDHRNTEVSLNQEENNTSEVFSDSLPQTNQVMTVSNTHPTDLQSSISYSNAFPIHQAEVESDQHPVNETIDTPLPPKVDNTTLTSALSDISATNGTDLPTQHSVNTSEQPAPSNKVETKEDNVSKTTVNNTCAKKTSKIPVRRTSSSKSLVATSMGLPRSEEKQATVEHTSTSFEINPSSSMGNEATRSNETDTEEDDLYSLASETSTEFDARTTDVQSPTSTNEVFLMIHQDGGESTMDETTIIPSTSSSTVHSATSFSSGLKSPAEFIPSGDPSKQNLSELVMDTQRLIKQMREEINMDDFESSTDDDFTDEYSDEYEDEAEDDDDEVDVDEEEEDDDEDWEDEFGDVMDDLTEGDEIDEEKNVVDNLPESLNTQEHRDQHNTSVLSSISASSKHSQSLTSEHNDNDENTFVDINPSPTLSNANDEFLVYIESENQIPELPAEAVAVNTTSKEQPTETQQMQSMAFVESESGTAELEPETVLIENLKADTSAEVSADASSVVNSSNPTNAPSILLAIEGQVESENALPELHVEAVLPPDTETLPMRTENMIPELQAEAVMSFTEPIASSVQTVESSENPTSSSDTQHSSPLPSSQNEEILPPSSSGPKSQPEPKPKLTKKASSIAKPSGLRKTNSVEEDSKPSTSMVSKTKTSLESKQVPSDSSKAASKKSATVSKIPKPKEVPNAQKLKPKTTPTTQDEKPKEPSNTKVVKDPKPRMPTRSKSFSGPPIGITSVKTITQRFLNQTKPQTNTAPTPKGPISVARKPSITEAINKLTKPLTSTELPSTSSLFRARTQPRLPKKKYHETCFSDDDYGSTTSEEELEPLEVRQRKMSIPVFRAYPIVQEPEEVNTEELVEKFVKEELVGSVAEAQIAATLVSMKFQQDVSLWAAKECSDLDHAIALLKQECELCSGTYALNEIVSMLKCVHKCCKQCAKTYFTVQITERSINDCNCPFCKLPELTNPNEHEDENLEYFSNLDIYLKNIVEPEVHELFQRKLRDRTLLKDPNFKWCVQCSSGFFARPKQKRLICPDCGSVTCGSCRKPWQKQHEGISCEKFAEWERGNDPEVQALGVQQHLEHNGIDCPKCKFKYSLARGGCMHFTCTQCKYEFCYGCARPFMMGAKCNISHYCAKLGLHAHHPRNCLFYLRDKLPIQLQILLKNNGVAFEVDPIDTVTDDEPGTSQKQALRCRIPIQKETPTGLVDTKCNSDVPDNHAGMCRNHYVEYLTAKVAKANIDPLPIFDLTDCVQELRRRGIPLPERGPWDTDEIYKTMCAEVIQKNIPLDTK